MTNIYMVSGRAHVYKFPPPSPTTTTTGVTSWPAGLRPQVKIENFHASKYVTVQATNVLHIVGGT